MLSCLYCLKPIRKPAKYCSNKCQKDYQYEQYIILWRAGRARGDCGINAKNISGYIKRYIYEKFGQRCSLCGWDTKHPITGKCPLEIDHIDGNSENNTEDNLRVICPNCHALTNSYRNLNKGNGREWRRSKYIKAS